MPKHCPSCGVELPPPMRPKRQGGRFRSLYRGRRHTEGGQECLDRQVQLARLRAYDAISRSHSLAAGKASVAVEGLAKEPGHDVEPPPPPLNRLRRGWDGGPFCAMCGSSLAKCGLFGRHSGCIHPDCDNYHDPRF